MLAPSSELLRAGVGLKLNQMKRAARSYLRDRTNQAAGTVTSYAVAAGLFTAAGIFAIAACLVGMDALFRWVEIHYGLFWAFGTVGGLLMLIAGICAGAGGEPAQAAATALPVADQPAACRRYRQSAQGGTHRGGRGDCGGAGDTGRVDRSRRRQPPQASYGAASRQPFGPGRG